MRSVCILKTDVLVVGGGFSGFWTAKTAREHVKDVLIVDKGPLDWGGIGFLSAGDIFAMVPEMRFDDLMEELVYYYDGLCDQDVIADVLHDSWDRFQDFEAIGHEFVRDEHGKLMGIPQRGLDHMCCFHSKPYGKGGIAFTQEMLKEMDTAQVRRMGRIMITDVVRDHDGVTGAVGFFTQSGRPVHIEAKAVVLTTNIGSWKCSYHANTIASGVAELALGAGVPLRNCEFFHVWNLPVDFTWEGQTGLLPKGGRFLNAQGEDFMLRYSPKYGAKADPHYNVRGMAHEVLEGRGPIYFDPSNMSPENREIMRPKAGWMKLNDDRLKSLGIDFFAQKTQWMPQLVHSYGGMEVDRHYATCVPGLYGAGRACSVDPGVYLGGWSLCVCAVSGYRAGHAAGRLVAEGQNRPRRFDAAQAENMLGKRLAMLGKTDVPPKDVVRALQEIASPVHVCILKNEQALTKALKQVGELRETVMPRLSASDPQQLCKCVEAQGILDLTEAAVRASLVRTESRAGHYREDFPDRDPHGPYWILVEREEGQMKTSLKQVPVESYPYKPVRYYMDAFNFPRLGESSRVTEKNP